MINIRDASVYYLILELLDGGKIGLLPDLEPLDPEVIVSELKRRTNLDIGNEGREWATWFYGNPEYGSELERANLHMFLQTQDAMTRIWKKVSTPCACSE